MLVSTMPSPCADFCCCYIDDVVIFSRSWEEHMVHVRNVLQCLQEAGITEKPSKCAFGFENLVNIGHLIGNGAVSVPESRVIAMKDFRRPTTKKDMRSFLGMIGYYRRFIKGFANYSSLLTPSTSNQAPGEIVWSARMVDAFYQLCKSLCNFCTLHIPVSTDSFQIQRDASSLGVGAVLNVIRGDRELPVAFFSRPLRGAEHRYSATELEALAVVAAIQHFLPHLHG